MATLAEVESVHVAARSVDYQERDGPTRCAVMRTYGHYLAPDRSRVTWFAGNAVGEPTRTDVVEVGGRAYQRDSPAAHGRWAEIEPRLKTSADVPGVVAGWVGLLATDGRSGFDTAFRIRETTSITVQGQKRMATLLPIEVHHFPQLLLPGIRSGHGGRARRVRHKGAWHKPRRIMTNGQLFVDLFTARPIRYVSTAAATLEDATTVVLKRSHVRFWYDTAEEIVLPAEVGSRA